MSEAWCGQSLSVGQPRVSCVPTGLPYESTFSPIAPAPAGSWSGQSTSALATPYGCHGRPQWTRPPRNSKAIMCMWASSRPRTSPNGVAPRVGSPLDVGLGLGIVGAAVGRLEREARRHVAEDEPPVLHAEPPVAQAQHVAVLDRPVGGLARRRLALDALGRDRKRAAAVAEEVAPGAVEQVAAERRGLQPEALALSAEPVAAVGGLGDLGAAAGQDVAAAGQRKAVLRLRRRARAATAISTPSATRTTEAKVPARRDRCAGFRTGARRPARRRAPRRRSRPRAPPACRRRPGGR